MIDTETIVESQEEKDEKCCRFCQSFSNICNICSKYFYRPDTDITLDCFQPRIYDKQKIRTSKYLIVVIPTDPYRSHCFLVGNKIECELKKIRSNVIISCINVLDAIIYRNEDFGVIEEKEFSFIDTGKELFYIYDGKSGQYYGRLNDMIKLNNIEKDISLFPDESIRIPLKIGD